MSAAFNPTYAGSNPAALAISGDVVAKLRDAIDRIIFPVQDTTFSLPHYHLGYDADLTGRVMLDSLRRVAPSGRVLEVIAQVRPRWDSILWNLAEEFTEKKTIIMHEDTNTRMWNLRATAGIER